MYNEFLSGSGKEQLMNVGIYIYEDAEVLDFAGPFEVFSTAARVSGREGGDHVVFNVFLVSETEETISARAGFQVVPHYCFSNHPNLDLLIIPGGVHTGEMKKDDVLNWIGRQAGKASLVASVCTGVFLLAAAGVVTDQKVTTHWEDIDDLAVLFPRLQTVRDVRWVDEGRIVSSAGISAGIDMSLHLVRRLCGHELAVKTARQMQFDWHGEGENSTTI